MPLLRGIVCAVMDVCYEEFKKAALALRVLQAALVLVEFLEFLHVSGYEGFSCFWDEDEPRERVEISMFQCECGVAEPEVRITAEGTAYCTSCGKHIAEMDDDDDSDAED